MGSLESLYESVAVMRRQMLELEGQLATELCAMPPEHRLSANNLVHYLALRQHDIRETQRHLSAQGLSSLGRSEAHVWASINAVLSALKGMGAKTAQDNPGAPRDDVPNFDTGHRLLAQRAEALLGLRPKDRSVYVMVTMPADAAEDYELVRDLVVAGMNVMRINCAHDDFEAWDRMISHARRAQAETGLSCRVLMDLAGPKLRTGPVEHGAGTIRWWPLRDDAGQLLAPARVWLTTAQRAPGQADAVIPVDAEFLSQLRVGDQIRFVDSRGRHRWPEVVQVAAGGCWVEGHRTSYLVGGIPLIAVRDETPVAQSTVGAIESVEQSIRVSIGDTILLTRGTRPGKRPRIDPTGRVLESASIGCTLDSVFTAARPGERIFFDDGKLGGVIRTVTPDTLSIEINRARSGKGKLRGDMGINLPDTELPVSGITHRDRHDLDFAVKKSDLVGLSFARRTEDVELLESELRRRGADHLGIIVKIENRQAFENVPRILLRLLQRNAPSGIMLARGDLGVEVGFERLAEVQEEILWLCEAAHLPVIWATQVLETLAKKGMPSRAEVTDAAMGGRAECVMLNKGPHIVRTVQFLVDVLQRMATHQDKKTSMLRRLNVSRILS